MINDFLILNCIGKDDKIGLKVNKDFFIQHFDLLYDLIRIRKND